MENDWDFNGDIYGDSIPLLAEYYCNRPHNFFPILWRMSPGILHCKPPLIDLSTLSTLLQLIWCYIEMIHCFVNCNSSSCKSWFFRSRSIVEPAIASIAWILSVSIVHKANMVSRDLYPHVTYYSLHVHFKSQECPKQFFHWGNGEFCWWNIGCNNIVFLLMEMGEFYW